MFVTNGFQALIDYRPSSDKMYSSSLRDKKTKPSFEPDGRVLISLDGNNWALDIHSTHSNRLLVMALIEHLISKNGDRQNTVFGIRHALCQIASLGVHVRELSPIIENEDSFNYNFRFIRTLRAEALKDDDVAEVIVKGLRAHRHIVSDILSIKEEDFFSNPVGFNGEYVFPYTQDKVKTLIFFFDSKLYLTNLIDTIHNRNVLTNVVNDLIGLRDGIKSTSRVFTTTAVCTLAKLVKPRVRIRPAVIIKRKDAKLSLIHRPFLTTEKSFDTIRPVVRQAARSLLVETDLT